LQYFVQFILYQTKDDYDKVNRFTCARNKEAQTLREELQTNRLAQAMIGAAIEVPKRLEPGLLKVSISRLFTV